MTYTQGEWKPQYFYIQNFPANDVWPSGGWSLYRINGDQIAERIKFDQNGKVTERYSWCGYIGCFTTLDEITAAIAAAMGE